MRCEPLALVLMSCTVGFSGPSTPQTPGDTDVVGDSEPTDSEEGDSDSPDPPDAADTPPAVWDFGLELDGVAEECPASARFTTSSGTDSWACITWTDTDLFLAFTHPDALAGGPDHFAWAYLWLGAPSGTTTGVLYNTQQPELPASFSHHLRVKPDGSYASLMSFDGGTWVDDAAFFAASGGVAAGSGAASIEVRIPRASLGSGTELHLVAGWLFEGTGFESTYAVVPDDGADGYNAALPTHLVLDLADAASPAEHTRRP